MKIRITNKCQPRIQHVGPQQPKVTLNTTEVAQRLGASSVEPSPRGQSPHGRLADFIRQRYRIQGK